MEDSGVSSSADITAANTETTPTLDEEAELAKAKDLLKSEKFDEASDALGIILERRAEVEGQLSSTISELYYLYGTAMIGVAKKQSVDLLSAMMQRKMRERSGDPIDEEEDEEQANDAEESLQIAWESLDAARAILEKDETKPLLLADVHMRLAEVHEESDNIVEAIGEYERALSLRRTHLEPHSRLLAEVYSCLAFDYSLEKRNAEAMDAYSKAAECIEKKIASLEEASGDKGKGKSDESVPAATEEIAELRSILEDVRERIDGLKDADAEAKAVYAAKALFSPPPAALPVQPEKPAEAPKPVQPVHHLGVFGRSKKIPLPAASASTSSSSSSSAPAKCTSDLAGAKRKRADEEPRHQETGLGDDANKPVNHEDGEIGKGGEVAQKKLRTEEAPPTTVA